MTVHDAISGGIWGLLIGDASGVPYEFQQGMEPDAISMPPPAEFPRSHRRPPPQAWSDTLLGVADPWAEATRRIRDLAVDQPGWLLELDAHIRPECEPQGRGSGYVVDCLHSARLASQETSFESVIRKAISLGDDTDTTAAVAGGWAGVRFGISGIPQRWLAALAGRAVAEPLVVRLLDRCVRTA